jgi:hypothetical protein
MGTRQDTVSFYGLRVQDDADWEELDESIGQCSNNGVVGYLQAGACDQDMTFLALWWRHVEPGEYVLHSGERPVASEEQRREWNDQLRAVAQRLGLEVVDGPGWFTMPDVG